MSAIAFRCPPECACPFGCHADHENDDDPITIETEEDQPCVP